MSVLLIGGDRIEPIRDVLMTRGAKRIDHWDMRKTRAHKRGIPECTECVVMLTDFLNHNAMNHLKKEAKKAKIPVVCAKRSVACVACALDRMGL
jgi:hypothetical protein